MMHGGMAKRVKTEQDKKEEEEMEEQEERKRAVVAIETYSTLKRIARFHNPFTDPSWTHFWNPFPQSKLAHPQLLGSNENPSLITLDGIIDLFQVDFESPLNKIAFWLFRYVLELLQQDLVQKRGSLQESQLARWLKQDLTRVGRLFDLVFILLPKDSFHLASEYISVAQTLFNQLLVLGHAEIEGINPSKIIDETVSKLHQKSFQPMRKLFLETVLAQWARIDLIEGFLDMTCQPSEPIRVKEKHLSLKKLSSVYFRVIPLEEEISLEELMWMLGILVQAFLKVNRPTITDRELQETLLSKEGFQVLKDRAAAGSRDQNLLLFYIQVMEISTKLLLQETGPEKKK